MIYFFYQ